MSITRVKNSIEHWVNRMASFFGVIPEKLSMSKTFGSQKRRCSSPILVCSPPLPMHGSISLLVQKELCGQSLHCPLYSLLLIYFGRCKPHLRGSLEPLDDLSWIDWGLSSYRRYSCCYYRLAARNRASLNSAFISQNARNCCAYVIFNRSIQSYLRFAVRRLQRRSAWTRRVWKQSFLCLDVHCIRSIYCSCAFLLHDNSTNSLPRTQ